MSLPNHLVIIPDGNRRWAQARNLSPADGHAAGAERSEEILNAAFDAGISNLTMWGSSLDNITKRSPAEIRALLAVFVTHFTRLLESKRLVDDRIRVSFLGRWREHFPKTLVKLFESLIERTKNNTGPRLTFLMAYSGIDEMTDTVRRIAERAVHEPKMRVDERLIKGSLWTHDLPPVDLVIRTGGAAHWSSGLLMWDSADTQMHFTETLWPDFGKEELARIFDAYTKTGRRFGA